MSVTNCKYNFKPEINSKGEILRLYTKYVLDVWKDHVANVRIVALISRITSLIRFLHTTAITQTEPSIWRLLSHNGI